MPTLQRLASKNETRRHHRIACHIPVNYVVEAKFYYDFIENVSYSGALIETPRVFMPGQEVAIAFIFPLSEVPIKAVAEIVWSRPGKFGVKFKSLTLRGKELQFNHSTASDRSSATVKKEARKMGRINKKRIRWKASSSADVVSYRIYWSKRGEVCYSSEHAELGKRTEVILPDDVPPFRLIADDIELGITAVNQAGNESEMLVLKAYFNFTVPAAPSNPQVEDAYAPAAPSNFQVEDA